MRRCGLVAKGGRVNREVPALGVSRRDHRVRATPGRLLEVGYRLFLRGSRIDEGHIEVLFPADKARVRPPKNRQQLSGRQLPADYRAESGKLFFHAGVGMVDVAEQPAVLVTVRHADRGKHRGGFGDSGILRRRLARVLPCVQFRSAATVTTPFLPGPGTMPSIGRYDNCEKTTLSTGLNGIRSKSRSPLHET